jgi:hypothetical protein
MLEDEPELREKIVGEQHKIEEQLAHDKKGRAVFFVNFPLTTQIINPDRPSAWQILEGPETQDPIHYLNELLIKYGKEPIETKTYDVRMAASTNPLIDKSMCTPHTGEAANIRLPETCRSLPCTSPK